ncbi:MAG: Major Facilitator Superfamily [Rhodobacteraceae bacterium HLUCCA12]|nr:MAG: Major Facilitator Superfamily [Rhodobacteraceae bacterium HLUCCA12]
MPLILTQFAASRGPMAAFVAIGAVWGAFMATMPDIKAALDVDDGRLGQLLLFGSVMAIAMMALAPYLGGWLGRGAVPLGTAAMALGVALPAQAATPLLFIGAMLIMGGASGAVDVWMNARLSTIEAERSVSLMNLNHAIYSFAYAGAAALTGVARAAGLSAAAILGMVALVVFLLALASIERDGRIDGFGRGKAAHGPIRLGAAPWLAGCLILVGFLTENAAEAWSALYIERDLGGGTGAGSAGPALLGLTMGIGRLAGQLVAARVSDQALMRGGLIVAGLGAALVVAANGVIMAYAGFMVLGFGASVVVPTALAVAGRLAPPGLRSHAIARATMLGYLGFFLGPPVLGLTAQLAGLRMAYGLVALALLVGLVLRAQLARHEPRQP